MEQNDLRQADLVSIFVSRGRVSEVVNGKRAISKAQGLRINLIAAIYNFELKEQL